MADLTVAAANTMLGAEFVPGTVYYLSLHTGNPGTTGANEVTGGSYARQAITFSSPSGGTEASGGVDASQSFPGIPVESGGTPYFGINSTSSGSSFMGGGSTSGLSGSISAGTTINFASAGITLTVS